MRRHLPEAILLGGAAGFLLLGFPGRWVSTFSDFGDWPSIVQSLLHGKRLFRDVHLGYGPLSPLLLLSAVRVFGRSVGVIAAFDFAAGLLAAGLTLRSSRSFLRPGERAIAAILMVGLILWMPGSGCVLYPYAPAATIGLVFALLCLLAGVSALRSGSFVAIGISGGAAGLAYLTKQETALAALAGLAAAAAAARGAGRPLWRPFLGFAATFLAVVAGGYAWCFRGLPFLELARANHLWPFGTAAPEWVRIYTVMGGYDRPAEALLAMSRAAAFLVALVSAVAAAWALARGREALLRRALILAGGSLLILLLVRLGSGARSAALPFLSLAPVAVGASFVSGLRGPRGARRTRRTALLALSVAAGLLLARVGLRGWAKGPFAGLGYTLSVPLLVYGTGRGLAWPFRRVSGEARAVFHVLGALAIPVLTVACVLRARELRQSLESFASIATPGGTVWMPRPWTTAFGRIGAVIGRPGTEEVAILPETHGLDFLYGRVNASPAPNMVPGILDEPTESRILEEWSRRPPATVVIFTYPYWVYGSAGFGVDYGIRLRGWISSRYFLLERAGPDETPYVVLARRGSVR